MSMKFLSSNEGLCHLNNQQKKDEAYFQTLLRTVEETRGLYYSYETYITLNLHRRYKMADGLMSKPIWKQVRGSIPLLWEQIVDLSYKPRLVVIEHQQSRYINFNLVFNWMQPMVVKCHFHDLMQRYGDTIVVDLTDQTLPPNHKRRVGSRVEMNHPIQLLFHSSSPKRSYLARISLNQRMCALTQSESICSFTADEDLEICRTCKAFFSIKLCLAKVDQGDEIDLEYSGTNALKADIGRLSGLIKDGMSALTRYSLNNFQDGVRQTNLISGNYTANGNIPSPFQLNKFETCTLFLVASALLIGGLATLTNGIPDSIAQDCKLQEMFPKMNFPSTLLPSIDLGYIEDKYSGLPSQALLNIWLSTNPQGVERLPLGVLSSRLDAYLLESIKELTGADTSIYWQLDEKGIHIFYAYEIESKLPHLLSEKYYYSFSLHKSPDLSPITLVQLSLLDICFR
uniref:SAC domain-containing protein n=1 Tax=Lactuca sativa TaxID=4236 RepID=A0A9R1X4E9_LACSA|nr:hypothetical protein LSAT_V11C700344290 [Lactuca sativa]